MFPETAKFLGLRRTTMSCCRASCVKMKLEMTASRRLLATYAETLYCSGHDSTRRRFRSTVEYQPKIVPVNYSDTQYMLPRRLTSTYVSYIDVSGPGDRQRPKWYRSSVNVHAVSNVVVVGAFRRLPDVEGLPDNNDDDGP